MIHIGPLLFKYLLALCFDAYRKYNVISHIRNIVGKYSNIIGILIIFLSVVIHIVMKSMIIAPFTAMMFIIGYVLINIKGFMKEVLLFFGNHSTNIWLVHMQFYMIFFKNVVFCTNTTLGCLIILLTLCVLSSYIINFINNKIYTISN